MKFKFKHSKLSFEAASKVDSGFKLHLVVAEEAEEKYKMVAWHEEHCFIHDLSACGSIATFKDNLFLSLGAQEQVSIKKLLSAASALAKFINTHKLNILNIVIEDELATKLGLEYTEVVEKFLVEFVNGLYYFDDFKSTKHELALEKIIILSEHDLKATFANVASILEGMFIVRDLANNPSNIATPSYLAEVAEKFAKISDKVEVEILSRKEIHKLGMHSFLSVAKGSQEEPKFIKLEYHGGKKSEQPIVLVGKGITFDSGGISLKPGANMDDMKYDMCGAATVLGAFAAVANLDLAVNLVVLVAACENMPSGHALKPGDIVTTMAGKTVEVLNTDAEGRLILCDALHYAKQFNPEFVIDLATLTGACVIALGNVASGLYVNDEELNAQIQTASNATDEKVWRMPLFEEYNALLKGTHADLLNIGGWGGKGGSVTAACFLQQFTDYKWAHLDIAGVANSAEAKGSTGRPYKLLVELIRNYAAK